MTRSDGDSAEKRGKIIQVIARRPKVDEAIHKRRDCFALTGLAMTFLFLLNVRANLILRVGFIFKQGLEIIQKCRRAFKADL